MVPSMRFAAARPAEAKKVFMSDLPMSESLIGRSLASARSAAWKRVAPGEFERNSEVWVGSNEVRGVERVRGCATDLVAFLWKNFGTGIGRLFPSKLVHQETRDEPAAPLEIRSTQPRCVALRATSPNSALSASAVCGRSVLLGRRRRGRSEIAFFQFAPQLFGQFDFLARREIWAGFALDIVPVRHVKHDARNA